MTDHSLDTVPSASPALPPDGTDVMAAAAGDRRAFERLYRTHADRVYSLAVRMLGDRAQADEVTQDVFVRVWQKLPEFRGESAFSTWLHRVAVNVILSTRKTSGIQQGRLADDEALDSAPSRPVAVGDRLDLEQAIAGLPKGARTVFVLHDVEGFTHEEIGEQLGITSGGSKAQLHRARMRHRASCASCSALANGIEEIVADAASLLPLRAPHDLWPGIESRLETAVVPLSLAASAASRTGTQVPSRAPRTISLRWFAMAATVLVAVSSGITWQFTRTRTTQPTPDRASLAVAESRSTSGTDAAPAESITPRLAAAPERRPAATTAWVSRVELSDAEATAPAATYEREIVALRRIVDERFAELDSATVTELRRNLGIIDQAIADSRKALARDRRSAMVSTQLDRALQAKLDLLRRVALL